jgi:hypothetical protein
MNQNANTYSIDPKKEIGCEKDEQFNSPVMILCVSKNSALLE